MDARQMAYLDAMGIDVWVPRGAPDAQPGAEVSTTAVCLGPGQGEILCVAASAKEAHMKLASNLSGAMKSAPVWAWPVESAEDEGAYACVADAVADRLITRILMFGSPVADLLLGGETPEAVGTARLHVVPSMAELEADMEAKRTLWTLMRETAIAAPRPGGK